MSARMPAIHSFRRRALRAAVPVLVMAGLMLLGTEAVAASSGVRMTESNERYAFTPAKVVVTAGSSVTWTNTTDVPHTVTADSGATFDSGQVADGKTFSMTFKSAGTIAYRCTIHPYMTGTIVVLAAGASLPPTDTAAVATSSGPGAPAGVPWILVVIGAAGLATVGVGVRRYANTGASRRR